MSTTTAERSAELLTVAAGYIERNGLADTLYLDPIEEENGWRPDHKCPMCPRGAIAMAAGQDAEFMVGRGFADLVDDEPTPEEAAAFAEIAAAERVLIDYILDELRWRAAGQRAGRAIADRSAEVIEMWADEYHGAAPPVIGAMRAAALTAATEEPGR